MTAAGAVRPGVAGVPPTCATQLAVALDTADLGRLRELAAALGPHADILKVGLEAFVAHGARAVATAAEHRPVFLDLKLHDIPATVAGAARAAAATGASFLTVHAAGGPAMVAAAAAAAPEVTVLAVTVLTSLDDGALRAVGQDAVAAQVRRLAGLAVEAGARGVVCAPGDLTAVRVAAGPAATLVTPGVRPVGGAGTPWPDGTTHDDQARVATPADAAAAGADIVVVGRPITGAADPAAAAAAVRAQLREVAPSAGGGR